MAESADSHNLPMVIAAVAAYGCQHNILDIVSNLLAVANVQEVHPVALHMFNLRQSCPYDNSKLKNIVNVIGSLKVLEKCLRKSTVQGKIKTTLFHFQCCYVNIVALKSEAPSKFIAFYNTVNECFPENYTSSCTYNVALYQQTRELYLKRVPNLTEFQFYSNNEAPKRLQSHKVKAVSELNELLNMLDEYLNNEFPKGKIFGIKLEENRFWKEYEMYSEEATLTLDFKHLCGFASFLSSKYLRTNLVNFEVVGTQMVETCVSCE